MAYVTIRPHPDDFDYERLIDLGRLSPEARALAEAIASGACRALGDITLQSRKPLRDVIAANRADGYRCEGVERMYTEDQLSDYSRFSWRGWSYYPADSETDPHDWLEKEAAKLPPGYYAIGRTKWDPVPSAAVAAAEPTLLTRDQALEVLRRKGRPIAPGTWSSYTARGQAPAPAKYIGRTPLWDETEVRAFAAGTWRAPKD